jgi:hypothetical protein
MHSLPRVVPASAETDNHRSRLSAKATASGVGSKTVIARSEATKQSIVIVALAVDCFASLAMTEALACPLHISNSHTLRQTRLRDLAAALRASFT